MGYPQDWDSLDVFGDIGGEVALSPDEIVLKQFKETVGADPQSNILIDIELADRSKLVNKRFAFLEEALEYLYRSGIWSFSKVVSVKSDGAFDVQIEDTDLRKRRKRSKKSGSRRNQKRSSR